MLTLRELYVLPLILLSALAACGGAADEADAGEPPDIDAAAADDADPGLPPDAAMADAFVPSGCVPGGAGAANGVVWDAVWGEDLVVRQAVHFWNEGVGPYAPYDLILLTTGDADSCTLTAGDGRIELEFWCTYDPTQLTPGTYTPGDGISECTGVDLVVNYRNPFSVSWGPESGTVELTSTGSCYAGTFSFVFLDQEANEHTMTGWFEAPNCTP